jgi:hypothetical protein
MNLATRGFGVVLAIALAATTTTVGAQQASLRTVLENAAQYVADFQLQLGGIVAEERYLQEVIPPDPSVSVGITINTPGRPGRGVGTTPTRTYRELRSDLLLVYPSGANRWVQFRDVFEMDGSLIRDRNDRLVNLFLSPSASTPSQVQRIQDESSRYNIGNLERTINVPVLPLMFLQADLQPRFEFNRVLDARTSSEKAVPQDVPDSDNFAVPPQAMEVAYRENAKGTLVRTTASRDLPAHGRFWIEPASGRVLVSELILDDPFVFGTVHVAYTFNRELDAMVPVEMREYYALRSSGVRINGSASYTRFRRFQVKVDESLQPIK